MLEFVIDNIFFMSGGHAFNRTVGIHMGFNCAPILTDLFLYSYEADFILGLLKKRLSLSFDFRYPYIDVVLSLNNFKFVDYFYRFYPSKMIYQIRLYTRRKRQIVSFENEDLRQKR